MNESFLVRSSSGDPYKVHFETVEGVGLRVFCTCPAGVTGSICKHKTTLMEGDAALLIDGADAARLSGVVASGEFLRLLEMLRPMGEELAAIGREIDVLKRAEKVVKARIGDTLRRGWIS